jgi:hypothetical protein
VKSIGWSAVAVCAGSEEGSEVAVVAGTETGDRIDQKGSLWSKSCGAGPVQRVSWHGSEDGDQLH